MTNVIEFTLPTPPSANRYWRNVNGHMTKSKEAKDYIELAGWKVLAQVETGVLSALCEGGKPLSVSLRWYRPAKRGDLDNSLKVALDALSGLVYKDDKVIVHIEAFRFEDKKNPRLEVTVKEWVA